MKARISLVGALVLAALAAPLLAQSIDLGPSVGYYRPLSRFRAADVYASDLPAQPNELAGPAWGGQLGLTFRNRVVIQTAFSTVTSTLPPFINPGFGNDKITGERVNVLTLEGQYDLTPSRAHSHLLVSAGPTFVQHRGEGYSRYGSPHSWGGAVGLEFVHSLTHQLQLTADLRSLVYSFNLADPPEHGTQVDGLFTVGVRWHANLRAVSPNVR